MNIIRTKTTRTGTIWAVVACSNRFTLAIRTGNRYVLTGYSYRDPDPALRHLKRI